MIDSSSSKKHVCVFLAFGMLFFTWLSLNDVKSTSEEVKKQFLIITTITNLNTE